MRQAPISPRRRVIVSQGAGLPGECKVFVLLTLGFSLLIGRRLAWALCKSVLYPLKSNVLAGIGCFFWGFGLALALRLLIITYQPHWAVKWFIGYGIGGYLAFINMGLLQEASIPPEAQLRHLIIETVPFISFIVLSVIFAYTLP